FWPFPECRVASDVIRGILQDPTGSCDIGEKIGEKIGEWRVPDIRTDATPRAFARTSRQMMQAEF
ncbi:MAG: hypothetical protein KDA91_17425, partial [Planctomycetaceae bacterium]|nr:hypothetical protein [Planctomycetaceae bacterium]